MKIAYVLYPDFTALDLVRPYEIIGRWPEADVRVSGPDSRPRSLRRRIDHDPNGRARHGADPDLIVVPGSGNPVPVLSDPVLIDWLRETGPRSSGQLGLTGAGLYAAAGLLEGKTTTRHWGFRDNLRAMGVEVGR